MNFLFRSIFLVVKPLKTPPLSFTFLSFFFPLPFILLHEFLQIKNLLLNNNLIYTQTQIYMSTATTTANNNNHITNNLHHSPPGSPMFQPTQLLESINNEDVPSKQSQPETD
jgi:hypothetical protein